MPLSKKRNAPEPVVNDSLRVNTDGDQNEKSIARDPYAGITIRDSAGRRIDPSELNQCLVIDRRKRHLRGLRPNLLSNRRKMKSDKDYVFQESPQLLAKALPNLRAPEREEPTEPGNPAEYDWATGNELSEVIAGRTAAQQTKHNARASPAWYTRDYEPEEAELMGDTELNQLLDDFYGETTAGEPDGKPPEETSALWYKHAIPVNNSIPYIGRSGCVFLDPRVYVKHPWGCGCNQESQSAPAEITSVPAKSTAEAHAYPWGCSSSLPGCERQDKPHAETPLSKTEMAGRISSTSFATSFAYEDIGRDGKLLPPARPVHPETARNPTAHKVEASLDTSLLSEPDNTFNISDWVHDQL